MAKPARHPEASPYLALGAAVRTAGQRPVVAFDPGWRTGWAFSTGDCGTIDLRRWQRDDEAAALIAFDEQAAAVMAKARLIVVERPMGRPVATEWPATLTRLLHMRARTLGLPRREITATEVRKALTGRAFNVPDAEIIATVKRLGYRPAHEHEADAAAVLIAWAAAKKIGEPS